MNPERILVVEDDGIIGQDLQQTLIRHGYSVPCIAATGERALEIVDTTAPDLVLMDISLGEGIDGIEAARRIHDEHGTPVIYLTGGGDDEIRRRAWQTSPYGYLVKPFAEIDLVDAIRAALDRHDSIQRLEAGQRLFVSTLKSIAEGVIATDLAGSVIFLNPIAEKLTGWRSVEACGRPLGDVFRVRDPNGGTAPPLARRSKSMEPRSITLVARDGTLVPIEDSTAPIKDDEGGLTGLVIVFRRRRRVSDSDREGEGEGPAEGMGDDVGDEQLVRMVESIVDPMFTMDADWRITYVNSQATGYFGTHREAVIGKVFWDDFDSDVRERYLEEFEAARREGRPHVFEFHHEARDQWFDVHTYPFADGILVLFRDITEQKRAEEEQAKLEKLEDLGFLARGFAHDFNNLLTILLGNVSLAASKIDASGEGAVAELAAAREATLEAQNLVQQLLTFAKGGAPIKKRFSLRHLLEALVEQHRESANPKQLTYRTEIDPGLKPVHADRGQLRRLFENLVRNAEQASFRRGEIAVEAEMRGGDGHEEMIEVRVIDRGTGISEEIREKVFEPYFSTKGDVNASGLGLTVCESIVKAHAGDLEIESTDVDGEGTIVRVFLPAVSGEVALPADPEFAPGKAPVSEPESARGAETSGLPARDGAFRVLVLEDEPLIRELIAANLSSVGYQVTTTGSGEATVAAYREALERGVRFDLVITDLSIPDGMGGAEAMRQIRALDPEVIGIVSSGYSNDPVMSDHEAYGFTAVLPKPYDPAELRALVESLLE